VVELLQELVRTPSVGGTRAESELQERLVRDFAASGLETDLWMDRTSGPPPRASLRRLRLETIQLYDLHPEAAGAGLRRGRW
jgi:hypothetical protein